MGSQDCTVFALLCFWWKVMDLARIMASWWVHLWTFDSKCSKSHLWMVQQSIWYWFFYIVILTKLQGLGLNSYAFYQCGSCSPYIYKFYTVLTILLYFLNCCGGYFRSWNLTSRDGKNHLGLDLSWESPASCDLSQKRVKMGVLNEYS